MFAIFPITTVNIYAPNIGAPQYIRQTLTDIKGEIGSNTIIVGDFGEGNGIPLQYSCLENPYGRRSLVGCSPWGCEELDMTKQLHFRSSMEHVFKVHLRKNIIITSFLYIARHCPVIWIDHMLSISEHRTQAE